MMASTDIVSLIAPLVTAATLLAATYVHRNGHGVHGGFRVPRIIGGSKGGSRIRPLVFQLFSTSAGVWRDGATIIRILYAGSAYAQVPPLVPNADDVPHLRRKQSAGTCYFHAAFAMMLCQSDFAQAYIAHLRELAAANAFARAEGESSAEAQARRFGDDAHDMDVTASRPFSDRTVDVRSLLQALESAPARTNDPEALREWARAALTLNLVEGALDGQRRATWSDQSRGFDAAFALLTGKRYAGQDVDPLHLLTGAHHAVDGGDELAALAALFRNTGLAVDCGHDSMVATLPCGLALCVGRARVPGTDEAMAPFDGAYSGCIDIYPGREGDDGYGHALAFVRSDEHGLVLVDSAKGSVGTFDEIVGHYMPSRARRASVPMGWVSAHTIDTSDAEVRRAPRSGDDFLPVEDDGEELEVFEPASHGMQLDSASPAIAKSRFERLKNKIRRLNWYGRGKFSH